jgi:hypothetical protein
MPEFAGIGEYVAPCRVCGRKMIVSIAKKLGSSNDSTISVECADCATWDVNFCKEHPDYCRELQEELASLPDKPPYKFAIL